MGKLVNELTFFCGLEMSR